MRRERKGMESDAKSGPVLMRGGVAGIPGDFSLHSRQERHTSFSWDHGARGIIKKTNPHTPCARVSARQERLSFTVCT
jgi:hypothetical protein